MQKVYILIGYNNRLMNGQASSFDIIKEKPEQFTEEEIKMAIVTHVKWSLPFDYYETKEVYKLS